ncbi:MAG: gamma-glutamyl-gamma-aminobutyrate hydrolase family protein, partial [bacterium]|nr:gamma-glutamyl-gamma-aminobutyrate hydrolase family protein [bacterium]
NVDETVKYPHLAHEVALIQEGLEKEIPILGICLGAQLIAKTLGEKVARHHTKEIGWYDLHLMEAGQKDSLFAHFEPMEKMFQWHGDTFDIPKGAVHLASSPLCENQAFRYRNNVYGVQFHMEVDEPMIQRWLTVGVNKQELDDSKGVFSADLIGKETGQHIGRLKSLGTQSFNAFIDLFGIPKKFRRFSSR